MGADGDGIGALPDGTPVYVPLTLPGELVVASAGGAARRWLGGDRRRHPGAERRTRRTRPARISAPAAGASLQHWRGDAYLAWKAGLLRDALRRAGFDGFDVADIVPTPPRARRRMDLAARRVAAGVVLGLHRPRSKEVVDLADCHVLDPALTALIAPLRAVLARLQGLRREASAVANLLDNGPDLLLRTDAALTLADRTALTAFARAHGLPRVAWALNDDTPEPVCVLRPPTVTLSGVPVSPPPGAFLQASGPARRRSWPRCWPALPAETARPRLDRRVLRGLRHVQFRFGRAGTGGGVGGRCRRREGTAHGGEPGRVVRADQRDAARSCPPAAGGAGAGRLRRGGAGPALRRRPGADGQRSRRRNRPWWSTSVAIPRRWRAMRRVLREAGYHVASATPIDQFLWSARLESVVSFVRA